MFYPLNYRALCNNYRYNLLFLFTINLNFTTFAIVWKNIRFVVVNPNFPVITKESALKAVAMAEEEMKRKAIEVLSSVLDNWVHGGDADCIIAEFEERLNIG